MFICQCLYVNVTENFFHPNLMFVGYLSGLYCKPITIITCDTCKINIMNECK